jgi:glutamine amidotransferase-like uncharacterized protein
VAALLRSAPQHFEVRYVGPDERLQLRASSFTGAVLYAQPGGDTSTRRAYRLLGRAGRSAIERFVAGGGHYLGICQGAYLAGSQPGLGLLQPGNAGWYLGTRGASTHSEADTVIPVRWGSRTVWMYFQDGAFLRPSRLPGERILARYTNGRVAALVKPYARGWVGVVGPHPEAPQSWYRWAGLADPDGTDQGVGLELVARLMGDGN